MKKPEVTEKKDIQERSVPVQPSHPQIFSDPDSRLDAESAAQPKPPGEPQYVKTNH